MMAIIEPLCRAVSAVAEVNDDSDDARTRRRPFEGELAAATLWPEVEKVFGHGYEVRSDLRRKCTV